MQHLDSMPCGIGPSPVSDLAPLNSSEGLEHVEDMPSLCNLSTALSVTPTEFHAQHFAKSSGQSGGRAKDAWIWFWPVESKEVCTPLEHDEPILFQRPKAAAVACRLCWFKDEWKAYKICDGVVTTLRTHMRNHHETIYEGYLQTGEYETALRRHKEACTNEPFNLAGFLEHLIRWMVADDQVSDVFILSLCASSDARIVHQRCRQSRIPHVNHISW